MATWDICQPNDNANGGRFCHVKNVKRDPLAKALLVEMPSKTFPFSLYKQGRINGHVSRLWVGRGGDEKSYRCIWYEQRKKAYCCCWSILWNGLKKIKTIYRYNCIESGAAKPSRYLGVQKNTYIFFIHFRINIIMSRGSQEIKYLFTEAVIVSQTAQERQKTICCQLTNRRSDNQLEAHYGLYNLVHATNDHKLDCVTRLRH